MGIVEDFFRESPEVEDRINRWLASREVPEESAKLIGAAYLDLREELVDALTARLALQQELIEALEASKDRMLGWLVSCPWCGEKMEKRAIQHQMTHLIEHGDAARARVAEAEKKVGEE